MKSLTKSGLATLVMAASVSAVSLGTAPVASADSNTLTIGQFSAYVDEFIPYVQDDQYTANIFGFAFDSLLSFDNKLQYGPDIAKSWTWSKDHKSITMHIDPKAVWSDGQPISSDDVLLYMYYIGSKVYNTTQQGQIGYVVSPIVGSDKVLAGKATSFAKTGGFTKINDKTFVIHLTSADPVSLTADIGALYPVPSHIIGKIPFSKWPTMAYDKSPNVVSGPYVFKKVQGTTSVEMVANPHYFRGVPKIPTVVWQTVSTDVAPGLLASGKLDFQINGLKPDDLTKMKQIPGITTAALPANQFYYFGLRQQNYPEFRDVRVRQAFEYAMDRNSMISGIMKGFAQPLAGPIPPVNWIAAPSKDLNPYTFSPAKANTLLDQAGWKIGKGGWRIDPATGKTADIKILPPQDPAVRMPIAQDIAQEFQVIHVKASVQAPLDIPTFYAHLQNPKDKSIMAYVGGWTLGTDPDPRGLWGSTDAANYEGWVDKHGDQLIKNTWALPSDFTTAGRKANMVPFQEYVNKQMPLDFLFSDDNMYAYNSHLNIPANDFSPNGPINPQQWTLGN